MCSLQLDRGKLLGEIHSLADLVRRRAIALRRLIATAALGVQGAGHLADPLVGLEALGNQALSRKLSFQIYKYIPACACGCFYVCVYVSE